MKAYWLVAKGSNPTLALARSACSAGALCVEKTLAAARRTAKQLSSGCGGKLIVDIYEVTAQLVAAPAAAAFRVACIDRDCGYSVDLTPKLALRQRKRPCPSCHRGRLRAFKLSDRCRRKSAVGAKS